MPAFYRPPADASRATVGTMRYEATPLLRRASARHGPAAASTTTIATSSCSARCSSGSTGKPFAQLAPRADRRRRSASTLGLFQPGVPPAPHVRGIEKGASGENLGDLGTYGAAGAIYGTPLALYAFDRALLVNRLLGPAATAQMWAGDPKLGAAALGQWQYSVPLAGCPAPVSVVERRGEIGGVVIRNFILPRTGQALVLFSRHGGFDFGEVWQDKGFAYRALSAVGCAT